MSARWQPQLRYYDLAHASERDAPVWMTMPDEDALAPDHPSLRELIGAGVFDNFRRRSQPARLEGLLIKTCQFISSRADLVRAMAHGEERRG